VLSFESVAVVRKVAAARTREVRVIRLSLEEVKRDRSIVALLHSDNLGTVNSWPVPIQSLLVRFVKVRSLI
jgi:hypothetical protein